MEVELQVYKFGEKLVLNLIKIQLHGINTIYINGLWLYNYDTIEVFV